MNIPEVRVEVLIVGGGLGGVAAALALARHGRTCLITESTDWLGGQATSQAVPPDENWAVETFGSTKSYKEWRSRIRQYYKRNYPLTAEARQNEFFNPGEGRVSRISSEPRIGVSAIDEMVAPFLLSGKIQVWLEHEPIAAEVEKDYIRSVTLLDLQSKQQKVVTAEFVLDATELGDLLPLAKVEHVTGSEAQADTHELHAINQSAQPLNQQAITWCFAMEHRSDESHVISKPENYDKWKAYVPPVSPPWSGPLLRWQDCHPHEWEGDRLVTRNRQLFPDWWNYRQIVSARSYDPAAGIRSVTLVNWPQIDYANKPLVGPGITKQDQELALKESREQSLSWLYWMQTEAPRPDGGIGYPGLRLRGDVMGTADGFAKAAYIRESRRILAEQRVTEQHCGRQQRKQEGTLKLDVHPSGFSEPFPDSVGIGFYRIDLHISTSGNNYIDVESVPFRIPLGSLIPQRVENLLAAGKNIGTTHITNGCYRLHPVEWNIGEAAGACVAYSMKHKLVPRAVRKMPEHLKAFQQTLINDGIPLSWPWQPLIAGIGSKFF
jgi:hypothetical protein